MGSDTPEVKEQTIQEKTHALLIEINEQAEHTGQDPQFIFNMVNGYIKDGNPEGALKIAQSIEATMRAQGASLESQTKYLQWLASSKTMKEMDRLVKSGKAPAEIEKQFLVLTEQRGKTAVAEAQLDDPQDIKDAETAAKILRKSDEYKLAQANYQKAIDAGKEPDPNDINLLSRGSVSIAKRTAVIELSTKQAELDRKAVEAKALTQHVNRLLAKHHLSPKEIVAAVKDDTILGKMAEVQADPDEEQGVISAAVQLLGTTAESTTKMIKAGQDAAANEEETRARISTAHVKNDFNAIFTDALEGGGGMSNGAGLDKFGQLATRARLMFPDGDASVGAPPHAAQPKVIKGMYPRKPQSPANEGGQ